MIGRFIPDVFFRKRHRAFYCFFKNVLGFIPLHKTIYDIALTHKSMTNAIGKAHRINNERLEYLGDAVLSAIVADYLYAKYPNREEGFLTEMRSKIVSRRNLNVLGRNIGLSQLIRYDKVHGGEFKSKDGDGVEALIGAIYLDKGYVFTRKVVVERLIMLYMDIDKLEHTEWNYKSRLLDWGQQNKRKISFSVQKKYYQGNTGKPQYDVVANIDGKPYMHAVADSIKLAEQLSAEKTYLQLDRKAATSEK